MNQDVHGSRMLFWMEVGKVNSGKEGSCSGIKDGNGRLIVGENKA